MSITDIVQSAGWKKFITKLYGWGASVVIIGALFKIMHWPLAGIMLTVGLLTEAIIFFFSAFEPPHEDLDWARVYPELAGMADEEDMEEFRESSLKKRGNVPLEKFEQLVNIDPVSNETINKLGEGLNRLSATASQISDISEATTATKGYVNSFQHAAQSLENMTSSYVDTSHLLQSSIGSLSQSYAKTAGLIEKSGMDISEHIEKIGSSLTNSYSQLANSVSGYSSVISQNGKVYESNFDKLNKNISELNTLFELQLQGTNDRLKRAHSLYEGMDDMLLNLKSSVDQTQKYKEEITKLSQSLSDLNTIYGNMLSAMSVKR